MSIPKAWLDAYPSVPDLFIAEIFSHFSDQLEAWYLQDWEKVGLKAGKLAETILCVIESRGNGHYPDRPTKPPNFLKACISCEDKFLALSRPLRIQLPRVLAGVYELRNNRSIGHVGGSVNPNVQDGEYLFRASKWAVSELSRAICDEEGRVGSATFYQAVGRAELPVVWEIDDTVRVLRPDLTAGEKALIILAHSAGSVRVAELQEAV